MPTPIPSLLLSSGHTITQFGFGTWRLKDKVCATSVQMALDAGYRHIVTAWIYDNQEVIGDMLKDYSIPREQLFITSKIWRDHLSFDDLVEECHETLAQLQ